MRKDDKEWLEIERMWQEHDRRIAQIVKGSGKGETRRSAVAWRSVAAAGVVALMAAGWLATRTDKVEDEESPTVAMESELTAEMSRSGAIEAKEPKKVGMVSKKQMIGTEPKEVAASDTLATRLEEAEGLRLVGVPTDGSFQTAELSDREGTIYIRCNQTCDAQAVAEETRDMIDIYHIEPEHKKSIS